MERSWMKGRTNANAVDLNRDFPDLDSLFYELTDTGVPRYDHLLDLSRNTNKVFELYFPFLLVLLTCLRTIIYAPRNNVFQNELSPEF